MANVVESMQYKNIKRRQKVVDGCGQTRREECVEEKSTTSMYTQNAVNKWVTLYTPLE